jgi:prepilin-type N-terminal cleavage/methylation domain-containing protein
MKTKVSSNKPLFVIRQRAVTLMELIASVAIMAILVVGALTLYSSAQSGSNTTQLLRDLTGVSAATKSLFAGQGSYGTTAALNATLIAAKAIPSSWTVNTTTNAITHQLNGAVTVTGNAANFTIQLDAVPQDVCVKLLSNSSTGWSKVKVGAAGTEQTVFPISPVSASGLCTSATNSVYFTS